MEVNIWSDIRCPFCYIGKHKFENALREFPHNDKIKIVWHSFELDPTIKTQPKVKTLDHMVENKGLSKAQIEPMLDKAVEMGNKTGLTLDFHNAVVANSFKAHRLIQMSKTKNLGNELEEALFKAHFEEGRNIDDTLTLTAIGKSVGLEEKEVEQVLTSDKYTKEVKQDKKDAARIGINGVPFFVFNKKYAVSGAQSVEAFSEILHKSWKEYEEEFSPEIINEGQACDTEGNCD